MKRILIWTLLAMLPAMSWAADERARHDINQVPGALGTSAITGELRQIKTSNDGFLLTQSSGGVSDVSGSTVIVQNLPGASLAVVSTGSFLVDGQGWEGVAVSTGQCIAGSNTLVWPAKATAVGRVFFDEGTGSVRVGDTATLTQSLGFLILGETSLPMDTNQRYFRGALYCRSTSAVAQNFSAFEATP